MERLVCGSKLVMFCKTSPGKVAPLHVFMTQCALIFRRFLYNYKHYVPVVLLQTLHRSIYIDLLRNQQQKQQKQQICLLQSTAIEKSAKDSVDQSGL